VRIEDTPGGGARLLFDSGQFFDLGAVSAQMAAQLAEIMTRVAQKPPEVVEEKVPESSFAQAASGRTKMEFALVGERITESGVKYSRNAAAASDGTCYLIPTSNGNILQLSQSDSAEAKVTVAGKVAVKGADNFAAGEGYSHKGLKGHESFEYGLEGGKEICHWCGAVAAPDGVIYTVPFDHNTVLRFDPRPSTFNRVTAIDLGPQRVQGVTAANGYGKYRGCVVGADGNVHAIPFNASSLLQIDVRKCAARMDSSVVTHDTLPLDTRNIGLGLAKWSGGVLAPDGCIYCAPFEHERILQINTSVGGTNAVALVGGAINDSVCGYSNQKYDGAVLGSNGKIYFVPHSATCVLEFDPASQTMRSFGNELSGEWSKWSGGALASDGCIHCVPANASEVLCINVDREETTKLGELGYTDSKWSGCAIVYWGGEGNIICAPVMSDKVLMMQLPPSLVYAVPTSALPSAPPAASGMV
jgi:hypothetical protein